MPLNIPITLPAVDLLREENIFVMDSERASTQGNQTIKDRDSEFDAHKNNYRNRSYPTFIEFASSN